MAVLVLMGFKLGQHQKGILWCNPSSMHGDAGVGHEHGPPATKLSSANWKHKSFGTEGWKCSWESHLAAAANR